MIIYDILSMIIIGFCENKINVFLVYTNEEKGS